MNAFAKLAGLLIALACALPLRTAAADDLLSRMSTINPDLHSYSATMRCARRAHDVSISRNRYCRNLLPQGSRPRQAADYQRLAAGRAGVLEALSRTWSRRRAGTRCTRSPDRRRRSSTTNLTLVPRVPGNVKRIEVRSTTRRPRSRSMRWDYQNGGWASRWTSTTASYKGIRWSRRRPDMWKSPSYIGDIYDHSFRVPYESRPARFFV